MNTDVIDYEKVCNLDEVRRHIDAEGYFLGTITNIDEFSELDVTRQISLELIYETLTEEKFDILPKLVKTSSGITVANLSRELLHEPVVIFHKQPYVNKKSSNMRYALLIAKVSAMMAKIDGSIKCEELQQVQNSIRGLTFLTSSERDFVLMRALYWLFSRHSIEDLIEEIESLNSVAKLQIVTIAKDIAISDAEIAKNEVHVLRELYRSAEIPTKKVVRDLKALAKHKNIAIAGAKSKLTNNDVIEFEVDDSLDKLLDDFSDF